MTDQPKSLGKIALGLLALVVAGPVSLMLLFVGAVETTGCFIECGESNLVGGLPLLFGAPVVAAGGITAAAWGFGARRIRQVFWWSFLGLSVFVLVIVAGAV